MLERGDSTETALGAGETYTGKWFDVQRAEQIVGAVKADAGGTLYVEQSQDVGDPREVHADAERSYTSGEALGFEVPPLCRYARVRYVNGSSAQSSFHLHVDRKRR